MVSCTATHSRLIGDGRPFGGVKHLYTSVRCEYTCGMKTWNHPRGYLLTTIKENGKRKFMLVHRLIMEQHLGRKLTRGETVHHVDGNKTNNEITNLELMQLGKHSKLHNKDDRNFRDLHGNSKSVWNKGTASYTDVSCAVCGKEYRRLTKYYTQGQKLGSASVCSFECRGKWARKKN